MQEARIRKGTFYKKNTNQGTLGIGGSMPL
jgi:hypothetical protein